jgi:hypothetical protein
MLISFTLLPSPDVRGWGETHSLDGPCWSLLQEYIANFLYAVWGRKMSKLVLWILVIISAIVLAIVANDHGDVGTADNSRRLRFVCVIYSTRLGGA